MFHRTRKSFNSNFKDLKKTKTKDLKSQATMSSDDSRTAIVKALKRSRPLVSEMKMKESSKMKQFPQEIVSEEDKSGEEGYNPELDRLMVDERVGQGLGELFCWFQRQR